ncbi:MAG: tripartite tricarboxylate transporter substrate binding protein [Alphaproteobacteria bacterium]|nr:tripartite tricarboxylate transporter substrate binding protein [Alphaproteobacteria bacterium]
MTRIKRMRHLVIVAALLLPFSVHAEEFPSKPIKLLVGASAGGTTDTLARAIGAEMAQIFGQSVVVENRPGAGGNIAAEVVAHSAPDGYTLLVSYTSHTINATLYPNLPFDPVNDFAPITMIATVPSLLVGNPHVPAASLAELIAYAKANPNKLTIAIGGLGSSLHMAGDLFKVRAGVSILNVPYKGTAPAMADVIGGHVDLMFISVVTGTAQVQAGTLRAYGTTSLQRLPSLPDVLPIADLVPGFESNAWFGLFGPAKLPSAVTAALYGAAAKALKQPQFVDRLNKEGASPVGDTPDHFAAFVRADVQRWAPIVRQSGAVPE